MSLFRWLLIAGVIILVTRSIPVSLRTGYSQFSGPDNLNLGYVELIAGQFPLAAYSFDRCLMRSRFEEKIARLDAMKRTLLATAYAVLGMMKEAEDQFRLASEIAGNGDVEDAEFNARRDLRLKAIQQGEAERQSFINHHWTIAAES
ncbi:MAG: hypothetical protein ABSD75_16210 [Terriglobales bacterium]